ncbi:MAG: hypothetical protein ACYTGG_05170 [Planctomycetota bacterium]|jgi:hypothetical protein
MVDSGTRDAAGESREAEKVADAASRMARLPCTKGLPEGNMFPSEEARLQAIEDIEDIEKGMRPRSWRALSGFLLIVLPSILGPPGRADLASERALAAGILA